VAPRISISLHKPGIPSGHVLLQDVGSLMNGLHDVLARLIQRQLGFSSRTKLRGEAKRLTAVTLTGVEEGSSVLQCEFLPVAGVEGRHPSMVAAGDLVNAVSAFSARHTWPPFLSPVARNRLGSAVAPLFKDGVQVRIDVGDHRERHATCTITDPVRAALQAPEAFSTSAQVELVGEIIDLNNANKTIKVDTAPRKITVRLSETGFGTADELRWRRVFVAGLPEDEQCRSVTDVAQLRLAEAGEENGITLPGELRRGENTEAYRTASRRSPELLELQRGWDTYDAAPPRKETVAFALQFLRDAAGLLLDYEIEVPPPFIVPTPVGGVQLEWQVGDRELELEFPEPEHFRYLAVDPTVEREEETSRWTAMRLVRWVATGEEV